MDTTADAETQRRQVNNVNGLKSINKYPDRFGENGLEVFVNNLEKNIHRPSPYDAEFITRFVKSVAVQKSQSRIGVEYSHFHNHTTTIVLFVGMTALLLQVYSWDVSF